jgi:hypothetical protein
VDWPGAFFYKDLIELYPHAKVLLSVRDSQAWARSIYDTIWGVFFGSSLMQHLSSARGQIDPDWCRYIELMTAMWQKSGLIASVEGSSEPAPVAQAMERYTEEVRQTVPADRLLVWSPAEGWEPLCEFLEVPVPQAPFPCVNDSGTFVDRIVDLSLARLTEWQSGQARFAAR